MAKFSCKIGFLTTVEKKPGVWLPEIVEKQYKAERTKNSLGVQSSTTSTNDNINLANVISIVADPFAYNNLESIRYITYMGAKWKITNIEVNDRPRLTLTIGGVYNAET